METYAIKSIPILYVLCPSNYETGGPDALHQLVFYLNRIGVNAKIVYMTSEKDRNKISIPPRYKCYIDDFLLEDDIIDSANNAVVISETHIQKIRSFKKMKIFIWWLSVDNNLKFLYRKKIFFLITLPLRILKHPQIYKNRIWASIQSTFKRSAYYFWNELPNITHLCASYYALDYVSKRTQNCVFKCIEPISKQFLDIYVSEKNNISKKNRKNVVLYNPVRGYNNILNKISVVAPELQFEPLRGLTQQQLIEKYKMSKLYIDFGAFPGAERIPKEAVLFGCAIITGRRGASNFYGDVPIPDEYKFRKPVSQINEIVKKIRYVFENYEKVYSDFDEYRKTVLNLEDNFIKSLKETWGKNEYATL